MAKMSGADILIECLIEQNVETVFGYPGGAVLNIYDALYKNKDRIKHILTAHEQGACHAADGYARSTRKTGVCIATSGPGATNLVTGIATAYMDSIPLVVITGNVSVNWLGRDSFQEIDIVGITMPITKHNYQVRDVSRLADIIREAFSIASEGRPGPVLIDIPKNIQINETEYIPKKVNKENKNNIIEQDFDKVIKILNASKKPFIYSGGGTVKSNAANELIEFAEKINSPVACSLMGLGGFPGNHELYTGMVGMHGTKASNIGVTHCDLLIVLGARFSDRVVGKIEEFAPDAKILHIDIDPAEVNKNVQAHYGLIGDIKEILTILNSKLETNEKKEWLAEIYQLKQTTPQPKVTEKINPKFLFETLSELTKEDTIIATDVGQHQLWTAQYYTFGASSSFVSSGGLGTMGYGLGAAIGSCIGNPDRKVILATGDGSFRMNINELATVSKYSLPIVILLCNNHVLGMVRQWQTLFYGGRHSQTTFENDLDFCKIAEGYGIDSYRVEKNEDIKEILELALKSNKPALINCMIDSDEFVLPMVAPGDSIDRLMININDGV
jgi:acetolactate synthase-1/2/3 large subunit